MTLLQSLPAGGIDRIKASGAIGLLDGAVKTLNLQYLVQGRNTLESFDFTNADAEILWAFGGSIGAEGAMMQ